MHTKSVAKINVGTQNNESIKHCNIHTFATYQKPYATQEHKTQVPLTCWPALAAKEYINRVVEFNIYCINDNNTSLLNGDGHNDQITHTHYQ